MNYDVQDVEPPEGGDVVCGGLCRRWQEIWVDVRSVQPGYELKRMRRCGVWLCGGL